METFVARSSAALNRIVDHISTVENKTDIRKYNDLYLHLLKIQRRAVDSEDEAAIQLFDREWSVCQPALDGCEDYDDSPRQSNPPSNSSQNSRKRSRRGFSSTTRRNSSGNARRSAGC